ncbi:MAG: hypothetical protein ACI9EK_001707 [Psychroserpens sp.]|jgi:hypothetical protein
MSIYKGKSLNEIEIIPIKKEAFLIMESTWQECLSKSSANSLFSSWIWLTSWWKTWQERLNLNLLILGVYKNRNLIGIVPCYTYLKNTPWGSRIKYCEFLGDYTQSDDSIRSEYLDFIFPQGQYKEIIPLVLEHLKKYDIDELILKDIKANSTTGEYCSTNLPECIVSVDHGIKINCQQGFHPYLSSLGKNTRLKIYNRRKFLKNIDLLEVKKESDIVEFFDNLNLMHIERWQQPCFSKHSLQFHSLVANYFLSHNQLKCLTLTDECGVKAVCYDIIINATRYNIQLGFHSYPTSKVSIGTLMLGYAIEEAHSNKTIEYYDLLAGKGKNTFYKKNLNGQPTSFITCKIPLTWQSKLLFVLRRGRTLLKHYYFVVGNFISSVNNTKFH